MIATELNRSNIEFTYSTGEDPLAKRFIVKTIEKIGGQRRLRKLYEQYVDGFCCSTDFFTAAVRLLELDVNYNRIVLDKIPESGPVVFIANHPYGVLDGIVLTWLAKKVRPDVKVMAHSVLCQAPEAKSNLLPVDFSGNDLARQTNIETRKTAIRHLGAGGAVGIFPAGGVAVSEKPLKGPAVDTAWHPFTAKLIKMSGATVIPIYFSGQNSRMFQIASHLSYTLRLSLFFFETGRRIGSDLDLVIGDPIDPKVISTFPNRTELLRHLRKTTYALAGRLDRPKTGYPQYDREFSFPRHIRV